MTTRRLREEAALKEERRFVLYVLVAGGVAILVLVAGFLLPLRRERSRLQASLAGIQRELAAYWQSDAAPLDTQVEAAALKQQTLEGEWLQLRSRLDTFGGQSPLTGALSSNEEGRIDFKIALYDARVQLRDKAAAQKVSLPLDLGIEEAIGADEDAETRRWQLAAIYELADLLIDLGVPEIDVIEAVPPIEYPAPPPSEEIAREFSVRVLMRIPPQLLADVIERLRSGESFFGLRRFRIEKRSMDSKELLSVNMVCAASVFLKPAAEPAATPEAGESFPGSEELAAPLLIEGEDD